VAIPPVDADEGTERRPKVSVIPEELVDWLELRPHPLELGRLAEYTEDEEGRRCLGILL